ncbi:hypothetical protein, partial [Salmonella sp. SAL4447]|uniref:hypothetical protein n=1 Tax=Salmonella sp. SAL4447 TaxID=3159902 RepID=UPI00397A9245
MAVSTAPRTAFPVDVCRHPGTYGELFRRGLEQPSDRPAIVEDDGTVITYGELRGQVSRLAQA